MTPPTDMLANVLTIGNDADGEYTSWPPPANWFTDTPDWLDSTWDAGLVQIGDGTEARRVAALVAPYKECILDGSGACWTAPESPTGYEFAHVGAVRTAEGNIVRIANVGGGVPHFDPTRGDAMSPAVDHYANTATRVMVGRYSDRPDLGGIVFLGSLWPDAGPMADVLARSSALSGDWRWVDSLGRYDMAGSQLVNNPGFRPARRSPNFAIVAACGPADTEVLRGAWTPPPTPPQIQAVDRLGNIERLLAALLLSTLVDDEILEDDDIAEADKWIPWYDDNGNPVPPLDHGPVIYDIPEAHIGAGRKHKKHNKAWYTTHPSPLSTPKEIVGSHAHKPHGPSIRFPALYEHLKAKGMSKRKAAMISNGIWRKRHGLPPKSARGAKGEAKDAGKAIKKAVHAAMLPDGATINGEPLTGANIALIPDNPDMFTVDGGDPAEVQHCTVKFLGTDATRWGDDDRTKVEQTVADWATLTDPVTADINETGWLGENGDAAVYHLDTPTLGAARERLSALIDDSTAPDTTDKYPTYQPHVTAGYGLDGLPDPPDSPATFSTVRVQWGSEYKDFPLGAARVAAIRRRKIPGHIPGRATRHIPGDDSWRWDNRDPTTGEFAPLGYVSAAVLKDLLSSDKNTRMRAEWAIRSKLDKPEAFEWVQEFQRARGTRRGKVARQVRDQVIGSRPQGSTAEDRTKQAAWDRGELLIGRALDRHDKKMGDGSKAPEIDPTDITHRDSDTRLRGGSIIDTANEGKVPARPTETRFATPIERPDREGWHQWNRDGSYDRIDGPSPTDPTSQVTRITNDGTVQYGHPDSDTGRMVVTSTQPRDPLNVEPSPSRKQPSELLTGDKPDIGDIGGKTWFDPAHPERKPDNVKHGEWFNPNPTIGGTNTSYRWNKDGSVDTKTSSALHQKESTRRIIDAPVPGEPTGREIVATYNNEDMFPEERGWLTAVDDAVQSVSITKDRGTYDDWTDTVATEDPAMIGRFLQDRFTGPERGRIAKHVEQTRTGVPAADVLPAPPDRPGRPPSEFMARILANGGFTYDMDVDKFPETGHAVGRPGHSRIITKEAFLADDGQGEAFLESFIADTIADRRDGEATVVGGWYDETNNEVVLDRVDVVEDREEARALGAERGEQAIFDLATGEEIDTGGTGGREHINIEGRSPDASGGDNDPGGRRDGRGSESVGEETVRTDGRPTEVAQPLPEVKAQRDSGQPSLFDIPDEPDVPEGTDPDLDEIPDRPGISWVGTDGLVDPDDDQNALRLLAEAQNRHTAVYDKLLADQAAETAATPEGPQRDALAKRHTAIVEAWDKANPKPTEEDVATAVEAGRVAQEHAPPEQPQDVPGVGEPMGTTAVTARRKGTYLARLTGEHWDHGQPNRDFMDNGVSFKDRDGKMTATPLVPEEPGIYEFQYQQPSIMSGEGPTPVVSRYIVPVDGPARLETLDDVDLLQQLYEEADNPREFQALVNERVLGNRPSPQQDRPEFVRNSPEPPRAEGVTRVSRSVRYAATGDVRAKAAKLNERIEKKGLGDPVVVHVSEPYTRNIDGEEVLYADVDVDVAAPPRLPGGWKLASVADWSATDQALVHNVGEGEHGLDLTHTDMDRHRCDHCGSRRKRNKVFVLRGEDGDTVHVGSTCIADFLGHNVESQLLNFPGILAEIEDDEFFEGGGGRPSVIPTNVFVAAAHAAVQKYGWAKSDSNNPTRSTTTDLLFPKRKDREDADFAEAIDLANSPESLAFAAEAIEWARNMDAESDFDRNLQAVAVSDDIGPKAYGIAAYMPVAYARHLDKQAEKAQQEQDVVDEPLMAVPEGKQTVEGTVIGMTWKDNPYAYGESTLKITVADDRGFRVWTTAPKAIAQDVDRGSRVKFNANLTRSDDDDYFGFGKRPSKAEILGDAAPDEVSGGPWEKVLAGSKLSAASIEKDYDEWAEVFADRIGPWARRTGIADEQPHASFFDDLDQGNVPFDGDKKRSASAMARFLDDDRASHRADLIEAANNGELDGGDDTLPAPPLTFDAPSAYGDLPDGDWSLPLDEPKFNGDSGLVDPPTETSPEVRRVDPTGVDPANGLALAADYGLDADLIDQWRAYELVHRSGGVDTAEVADLAFGGNKRKAHRSLQQVSGRSIDGFDVEDTRESRHRYSTGYLAAYQWESLGDEGDLDTEALFARLLEEKGLRPEPLRSDPDAPDSPGLDAPKPDADLVPPKGSRWVRVDYGYDSPFTGGGGYPTVVDSDGNQFHQAWEVTSKRLDRLYMRPVDSDQKSVAFALTPEGVDRGSRWSSATPAFHDAFRATPDDEPRRFYRAEDVNAPLVQRQRGGPSLFDAPDVPDTIVPRGTIVSDAPRPRYAGRWKMWTEPSDLGDGVETRDPRSKPGWQDDPGGQVWMIEAPPGASEGDTVIARSADGRNSDVTLGQAVPGYPRHFFAADATGSPDLPPDTRPRPTGSSAAVGDLGRELPWKPSRQLQADEIVNSTRAGHTREHRTVFDGATPVIQVGATFNDDGSTLLHVTPGILTSDGRRLGVGQVVQKRVSTQSFQTSDPEKWLTSVGRKWAGDGVGVDVGWRGPDGRETRDNVTGLPGYPDTDILPAPPPRDGDVLTVGLPEVKAQRTSSFADLSDEVPWNPLGTLSADEIRGSARATRARTDADAVPTVQVTADFGDGFVTLSVSPGMRNGDGTFVSAGGTSAYRYRQKKFQTRDKTRWATGIGRKWAGEGVAVDLAIDGVDDRNVTGVPGYPTPPPPPPAPDLPDAPGPPRVSDSDVNTLDGLKWLARGTGAKVRARLNTGRAARFAGGDDLEVQYFDDTFAATWIIQRNGRRRKTLVRWDRLSPADGDNLVSGEGARYATSDAVLAAVEDGGIHVMRVKDGYLWRRNLSPGDYVETHMHTNPVTGEQQLSMWIDTATGRRRIWANPDRFDAVGPDDAELADVWWSWEVLADRAYRPGPNRGPNFDPPGGRPPPDRPRGPGGRTRDRTPSGPTPGGGTPGGTSPGGTGGPGGSAPGGVTAPVPEEGTTITDTPEPALAGPAGDLWPDTIEDWDRLDSKFGDWVDGDRTPDRLNRHADVLDRAARWETDNNFHAEAADNRVRAEQLHAEAAGEPWDPDLSAAQADKNSYIEVMSEQWDSRKLAATDNDEHADLLEEEADWWDRVGNPDRATAARAEAEAVRNGDTPEPATPTTEDGWREIKAPIIERVNQGDLAAANELAEVLDVEANYWDSVGNTSLGTRRRRSAEAARAMAAGTTLDTTTPEPVSEPDIPQPEVDVDPEPQLEGEGLDLRQGITDLPDIGPSDLDRHVPSFTQYGTSPIYSVDGDKVRVLLPDGSVQTLKRNDKTQFVTVGWNYKTGMYEAKLVKSSNVLSQSVTVLLRKNGFRPEAFDADMSRRQALEANALLKDMYAGNLPSKATAKLVDRKLADLGFTKRPPSGEYFDVPAIPDMPDVDLYSTREQLAAAREAVSEPRSAWQPSRTAQATTVADTLETRWRAGDPDVTGADVVQAWSDVASGRTRDDTFVRRARENVQPRVTADRVAEWRNRTLADARDILTANPDIPEYVDHLNQIADRIRDDLLPQHRDLNDLTDIDAQTEHAGLLATLYGAEDLLGRRDFSDGIDDSDLDGLGPKTAAKVRELVDQSDLALLLAELDSVRSDVDRARTAERKATTVATITDATNGLTDRNEIVSATVTAAGQMTVDELKAIRSSDGLTPDHIEGVNHALFSRVLTEGLDSGRYHDTYQILTTRDDVMNTPGRHKELSMDLVDRTYELKSDAAATAETDFFAPILDDIVNGDHPAVREQMAAWGGPNIVFFTHDPSSDSTVAWSMKGTSLIGLNRDKSQLTEKEGRDLAAQMASDLGEPLPFDVVDGPPVSKRLVQEYLDRWYTATGIDGAAGPYREARSQAERKSTFLNGRAVGDTVRHEYGHLVDFRQREARLRKKERDAFFAFARSHRDAVREVSTYASSNDYELFAELFSTVNHPRFAERTGFSDDAEQLFALFSDAIRPVGTSDLTGTVTDMRRTGSDGIPDNFGTPAPQPDDLAGFDTPDTGGPVL